MTTTSLLELRGATKRYGAVEALRDVDLAVRAGEVVAIVGDNGAGKSTLVKALSGAGPLDEGRVVFEGREVQIERPHDSRALGIATVYQDLALCDQLDVVANLYLGRERRGGRWSPRWALDESGMEDSATELLGGLSVRLPAVRARVADLSGGQRQSIAIARALLGDPKVVLLDEPTAALGVAQTRQALVLIRGLRDRGLGVVLISHNLTDVLAVADRIVVLRLGRVRAAFDAEDATADRVVAAITGVDEANAPISLPGGDER
jgi:D-xylose transport system ATP-binding protein